MKTKQELLEERAALIAEIDGADEKRFAEIKARVAKIDYAVEQLDVDAARKAQDDHDAELRAAREKTPKPADNGAEERGKQIIAANGANAHNGVATPDMDKATALRYARSAFGKQVRAALDKLPATLNENEKRAIGIAITTTSETYTQPSAAVDGVNNGGVFIPQNVLYDLLELDTVDSAFYRDVAPSHIKGALIFPYVVEDSNGATKGKKETVKADDRSIKWGKLTLAQGNYPLTIEVTMELLALTDEEFAEYLLKDLANEMNLLLADEVLYGTGADERIAGQRRAPRTVRATRRRQLRRVCFRFPVAHVSAQKFTSRARCRLTWRLKKTKTVVTFSRFTTTRAYRRLQPCPSKSTKVCTTATL